MTKSRRSAKRTQPPAGQPRWLLPALLVGVGLVLVAVALALIQRGQQTPFTAKVSGSPALEVDQDVIDYGNVRFNTPVESVFRLRNVGDQPLRILQEPQVELVEGCWPPRAVVSSTTINPGDEATVRLQFTMHEGMGGPHEFRVQVLTNDPSSPQKDLIVRSVWVP